MSIDTLYLFLRPLRVHIALLKNIDYSETEKIQRISKFYRIIVKYGLLVGLIIISSFLAYPIAFGVYGYGTFIGFVDNPLNIICIVLLKADHQKIYNKLCGICNKGCIICCGDEHLHSDEIQLKDNNHEQAIEKTTSKNESTANTSDV